MKKKYILFILIIVASELRAQKYMTFQLIEFKDQDTIATTCVECDAHHSLLRIYADFTLRLKSDNFNVVEKYDSIKSDEDCCRKQYRIWIKENTNNRIRLQLSSSNYYTLDFNIENFERWQMVRKYQIREVEQNYGVFEFIKQPETWKWLATSLSVILAAVTVSNYSEYRSNYNSYKSATTTSDAKNYKNLTENSVHKINTSIYFTVGLSLTSLFLWFYKIWF